MAVVVDLSGKVGVILVGRLEDDLGVHARGSVGCGKTRGDTGIASTNLGAICEFMRSEVDLSKRALSDQATESVVADRLEILAGELAACRSAERKDSPGIDPYDLL